MLHIQWKKTFKLIVAPVLVIISSFFQNIFSQEINQPNHDDKPYYFGISLSGNISRFRIDQHPLFLQRDTVQVAEPLNSGGFGLGLLATARLNHRFELRFNPQLTFTERNLFYKLKYADAFEGANVTKKVESVMFMFPVQVKFRSDRIGNFRVYMLGGAKADIDMAANARSKKSDDLVKLQAFDYGIEAGLGFNFYYPSFILSPEIKISNGMRNIHSRDKDLKYSNVIDKINSRMIIFSIHIEG